MCCVFPRPRANIPGDNRRYLSFWGEGGTRGCCHNEYTGTASGTPAWGKAFKMFFYLAGVCSMRLTTFCSNDCIACEPILYPYLDGVFIRFGCMA